jgi:Na+/H+-dicarboxylate symporter
MDAAAAGHTAVQRSGWMRQLSQSLAANLAVLDKMFGTSADYYAKEITIYHCRGSILLFDGTGTALMLTIFALQDSFGTAGNVTGGGAIAVIMDKIYRNMLKKGDAETPKIAA